MSVDIRKLLEVVGGIVILIGAIFGAMHYQDDKHAGKTVTQVKFLERDVKQKSSDAEKYRVQNLYWCERAEKNPNDKHAESVCEYLEAEQQVLMEDVKEDRMLLKRLKGEQ